MRRKMAREGSGPLLDRRGESRLEAAEGQLLRGRKKHVLQSSSENEVKKIPEKRGPQNFREERIQKCGEY